MGVERIFTGRKRPVPRLLYLAIVVWSLYGVMSVLAHHPPSSKPYFLYVGSWVVVGLNAPLWAVCTILRLDDLKWGKWWVLALGVPWALSVWAAWRMRWIESFAGMTVVIVAQAPLVLLPARKEHDEAVEEPW